jgi:hypothetical protein
LKPLERSASWSKILPTSNGKTMSWKESSKSMNQEPKSNLLSSKPSLKIWETSHNKTKISKDKSWSSKIHTATNWKSK